MWSAKYEKELDKNPLMANTILKIINRIVMAIFKKIKFQIFTLVLFLICFQFILSFISFYSIKNINSALEDVFTKKLPAIDNLVQADRDFQQALVAERTLLIENIDKKVIDQQIKDFAKNKGQVLERFSVYEKTAELPEELLLIKDFHIKYKLWSDYIGKNLGFTKGDFSKSKEANIDASLVGAANLFEASRGDMDKLQELVLNDADLKYKNAQVIYENSINKLITFLMSCLIISAVVSFLIVKSLTAKIAATVNLIYGNTEELNSISTNLNDKSVELSSIAQEQSSSVEETSSSLHEISQMVKKNTDVAVSSAQMVETSKTQLDSGISLIFKLAERIKDVNSASTELSKSVEENHARLSDILAVFNQIQNKTSVINDIVFQTKLLSFNASVEAARAGEHGKGFSVVAEEIGGLAQQSGKSANEISSDLDTSYTSISGIIQRSKDEVFSAVTNNKKLIDDCLKLSVDCEEVLKKMGSMFETISNSSNEIAVASKEQNAGVEEINTAVQEISDSNQVTAQRSHDVEGLARNIGQISVVLNESVEELNKMI